MLKYHEQYKSFYRDSPELWEMVDGKAILRLEMGNCEADQITVGILSGWLTVVAKGCSRGERLLYTPLPDKASQRSLSAKLQDGILTVETTVDTLDVVEVEGG